MPESDAANTRVGPQKDPNSFDRYIRVIQQVGFPIVVSGFLLWEWHQTVNELQKTLTEVKLLLQEVRHEIKKGQ